MTDAFYIAGGDGIFVSTERTIGPWVREAQHAGPPSALLGRAVETLEDADGFQPARITFDILRPVPVAPLEVSARILRPGRRVKLADALLSADGTEVMRARAWLVRTTKLDVELDDPGRTLPPPESSEPIQIVNTGNEVDYTHAMEWRLAKGTTRGPGTGTVWVRARYPLVDGEEPSPLSRVLLAADSASGVSAALDWSEWLFINVDLSVYFHRLPAGEWVCLDARTTLDESGVGVAESVIYDERGPLGRSLQALYVTPR